MRPDRPSGTMEMASNQMTALPPSASFTYRRRVYSEGEPSARESAPSMGAMPRRLGTVTPPKLSGWASTLVSWAKGRLTPSSAALAWISSTDL